MNEWIKQNFIEISEVDRDKIAEFSDGNFRVARALAETLGRGETLGSLKSRDLFERIFRQRNQPDQQLLQAGEDLSLLYSVNGEDVSDDSELGRIGAIRGTSIRALYEALAEMRKRGVVQARGSFRAVLPQAIANPLAAHALDRIPPAFFDQFCRTLTPRMLKSVSRRLGFLHDSAAAQATVARWLRADGPLGDLMAVGKDGFQIIANIAPVTPEAVLARFEGEIDKLTGDRWVGLTKSIGYDPSLFDRAATLLARFASSEPESNNLNSVRNNFSELFHIYLSGTKATPEQRRSLIKRFAASSEKKLRSSVPIALQALLKADAFMSSARHDFGARSRDWGWHPRTHQDIWDWYQEAIPLAVELLPDADARTLLAKNARSLWYHPPCQSALERTATAFSERQPWIEGWIALRAALRFDGKNMPGDVRTKLEQLTERLKPLDLLNRARAIVFNRMNNGWDFADGEESDDDDVTKGWERANKAAQEIGRALVHEPSIRAEFLAELLLEPHAQRAFELGRGLAEDVDDLNTMWHELVTLYEVAESNSRNPIVLCGFLCEAQMRDQDFTSLALDAIIDNHNLAPALPRFQGCIGIDTAGIARLRKAVAKNVLVAGNFYCIANGSVSESPPEPLAALLEDIATLSGGVEMALDLLHMRLYRHKNDVRAVHPRLISVGRTLLTHATFKRDSPLRDFAVHEVILVCFAGDSGRTDAERLCTHVRSALESHQISSYDLKDCLKSRGCAVFRLWQAWECRRENVSLIRVT